MAASFPAMLMSALYIYGKALLYGCMVVFMMVLAQLRSPTKNVFKSKKREIPPKCLQEVGQDGYVTVQGLKFHYVEKGDRSKPLMLFVHGFPEFWYSWRHQMNEFSKDYWTVAIDMRGYGDSDKPPNVSDYYMELMVDDIKGIVNELGRKTFILVAHDWGALISWKFVDKYPEMIDKYIMMNGAHPKIFGQMIQKSKEQLAKSWYVFFFQLPLLPEIYVSMNDFAMFSNIFTSPQKNNPHVTDEDIEAFKYTFSKPGAKTPPINYYRASMLRRVQVGYGQQKVTEKVEKGPRPPGLYIFGAKDIAIDIANVDMHKKYFEPIETVIIEEGNHFVQQDEVKAVNNAMRAFLK